MFVKLSKGIINIKDISAAYIDKDSFCRMICLCYNDISRNINLKYYTPVDLNDYNKDYEQICKALLSLNKNDNIKDIF